jgi:excisionase family DNA binding protein
MPKPTTMVARFASAFEGGAAHADRVSSGDRAAEERVPSSKSLSNQEGGAPSGERVRRGDVLTADEVAAWFRVDRKTVYDAAGRGELPHRRLGKRLLFSRAALVDWLACRYPASTEG